MTGPDGQDHAGSEDLAAEHARFEFDDAAYLLGALDAERRADFERHLTRCPTCRDQLAEFGDLPQVLARADFSAWFPEPPPATLLPRLLRQVTASRRRRAWRIGSLAAAAACLLVLLATAGVLGWQHTHRPQTLVMQPVGSASAGVRATVQVTGSGSDTRVKLVCGYTDGSGHYPRRSYITYRMVIFNHGGDSVELGSWAPQPDEDVQITRTSPWPRQSIGRIEVSDDRGRTVLLLRL